MNKGSQILQNTRYDQINAFLKFNESQDKTYQIILQVIFILNLSVSAIIFIFAMLLNFT